GVGGVSETGPFNPHFARDVGAAFLVAGAAILWFARDPARWPAAATGAAFLTAHALIHLWDGIAGREAPHHLMRDLPVMFVTAGAAIWVVMVAARKERL